MISRHAVLMSSLNSTLSRERYSHSKERDPEVPSASFSVLKLRCCRYGHALVSGAEYTCSHMNVTTKISIVFRDIAGIILFLAVWIAN